MISRLISKIKRKLGIKELYQSETSKIREMVLNYCLGRGCDIGFGGDKIKKTDCVGIDYATPYAFTGKDKVDIPCDVMNEKIPVNDGIFDYVYSSHLIEDFVDTKQALIEFIRILRNDGNLILIFPDQKVYETHCLQTGQILNSHHIHKDMGLAYMISCLDEIPDIRYNILYQSNCEVDYNVVLVLKIEKRN